MGPKLDDRGLNESVPFYKRGWFQGAVAVVGLVGAAWALLGAPRPWEIFDDIFSPDLPASNTEIILDASDAMGRSFGAAGTKLDAASNAVGDYVIPRENEGFALRRFGGECEDPGELLVDFGGDNGDDVRESAAEQPSRGESNLARAVIAAVDDFNDADQFPDRDSPKRVLIFTGTVDECLGGDAPDEIRREVERTGIDVLFELVGMKIPPEDREQLRSIENELGENAELDFVTTPAELAEVVPPPGSGATDDGGVLPP